MTAKRRISEGDYVLVQRLTQLRIALRVLSDAIVHLPDGERRAEHIAILNTLEKHIHADDPDLR